MKLKSLFHLIIFIFPVCCGDLTAQSWNFVKEKNGIRMFTQVQEGSSFKCFKGETDFHATMEQLGQYIGVANNFDQWDENIRDLRVLASLPGQQVDCYFVYKTPWPLSNRDFYARVDVMYDTATRTKTVYAYPLEGEHPSRDGVVRIKDYWLRWILTETDGQTIHGIIEGFIDPAGMVPSWLYNLVIVEAPYKVMSGIKHRVETGE
jgi:hypothetical protein